MWGIPVSHTGTNSGEDLNLGNWVKVSTKACEENMTLCVCEQKIAREHSSLQPPHILMNKHPRDQGEQHTAEISAASEWAVCSALSETEDHENLNKTSKSQGRANAAAVYRHSCGLKHHFQRLRWIEI